MDNICLKKFIIIIVSMMCLVSCDNVHKDIKKYSENCMQLLKEKDSENLVDNFCESIKKSEKDKILNQMDEMYEYIYGNISSYEFVTEGGGTQKIESGEYQYYNCYPEFNVTTDTGENYTVIFGIHYICSNEPEKQGIYMIEISSDDKNKFVVGHNV